MLINVVVLSILKIYQNMNKISYLIRLFKYNYTDTASFFLCMNQRGIPQDLLFDLKQTMIINQHYDCEKGQGKCPGGLCSVSK